MIRKSFFLLRSILRMNVFLLLWKLTKFLILQQILIIFIKTHFFPIIQIFCFPKNFQCKNSVSKKFLQEYKKIQNFFFGYSLYLDYDCTLSTLLQNKFSRFFKKKYQFATINSEIRL